MIKRIIYSLLRSYKTMNTWEEDYLKIAKLLVHRHIKRGRNCVQMNEYILHLDMRVRQEPRKPVSEPAAEPTTITTNNRKDQLFLCMEYSRHDLP